jgi:hypothetical protein
MDGIVDGVGNTTFFLGEWIRKIHIGNIAYYIMVMTGAIIAIFAMMR